MTWREVPLGSISTIFDGPHATPEKTDEGPVFLGISNLNDGRIDLGDVEHLSEKDFVRWTRRVTPGPDDVVFSYETRLGQAAIIPQGLRCCLGRRMGLLRSDPTKVDPRFLLYAYLGPDFQEVIRERTVYGSTVERILLEEMGKFTIRLAPLPEQRAIARILGALDDKIELNRRMNETLETTARALFKSWFVDFDAVRAKADGRRPSGMDAETAALFPSGFVNSGIGKIPKGWRVLRVPDAIDVNPTRSISSGTVAPYVDMGNLPTSTARVLGWIDREFTSGSRFTNGDALVARITPCLENGKTALVDFLGEGQVGWGSTEFIVLRSRPPLSAEWTYLLARTETFRSHAIANMTGTSGRQRVPTSCLHALEVVVPSDDVAASFGTRMRPLMAILKQNDEESRTLASLRDSLLPKLLSGEVRVGDAEKFVEARA